MSGDPREVLNKLDNDDYLRSFITGAWTATTADMNQTRVASEVLLARTISDRTEVLSKTVVEQTAELTSAIREHADALVRSARAAELPTRSLKWATWALFLATLILGAVADLTGSFCTT